MISNEVVRRWRALFYPGIFGDGIVVGQIIVANDEYGIIVRWPTAGRSD